MKEATMTEHKRLFKHTHPKTQKSCLLIIWIYISYKELYFLSVSDSFEWWKSNYQMYVDKEEFLRVLSYLNCAGEGVEYT
jgi:hypothetical protein